MSFTRIASIAAAAVFTSAAAVTAVPVEIVWRGAISQIENPTFLPFVLQSSNLALGQPVELRGFFETDFATDDDPDPAHAQFFDGLDALSLSINSVSSLSSSDAYDFLEIYTDDGGGSASLSLFGKFPPAGPGPGFNFFGPDRVEAVAGLPLGALASDAIPTANAFHLTTPFNGFTYESADGGVIRASVTSVEIIVVPAPLSASSLLLSGLLFARRRR